MRTKTRTSSVKSLHTNVSIALSKARLVLGVEVGVLMIFILPCTHVTRLASPVSVMLSGLRQWLVGIRDRATAWKKASSFQGTF